MQGIHVFWTTPLTQSGRSIRLQDFEMLTWALSVLTWRKWNGPLRLHTDEKGAAFVKEKGLEGLYNDISLSLKNHNANPVLYWSSGKFAALAKEETPIALLDVDTIVWKQLDLSDRRVVVLHAEERLDWPCYTENRERFGPELEPGEWDWTVPALNTAFLHFGNLEVKQRYLDLVEGFMKRADGIPPLTRLEGRFVDHTVFVEQRLLGMLLAKMRMEPGFLGKLNRAEDHLERNTVVSHLWNSKRFYRRNPSARRAACNYMIHYLLEHFPEHTNLLDLWNMRPVEIGTNPFPDPERGHVTWVDGDVEVIDANFPCARKVWSGEILGPGETLRMNDGRCRLKRTNKPTKI